MAEVKAKKYEYWETLWKLVEEYPQVLICEANNVGSNLLQDIRTKIRGQAVMLFGKNTLIRAGLKHRMEEPTPEQEDYEKRKDKWFPLESVKELIPNIKGNVGLIFCKGGMDKILDIIENSTTPAEAKAGTVSPCNVFVPPGPTGMDPSQTAFFQALGISTKIAKGQIEIITEVQVIEKGKKVGNSEAVLLKKLNIKPFKFGLKVTKVFDNGSVYSAEVLKLTPDIVIEKFLNGVRNIAAMSLELGIPTAASVPHSVLNGFKNLVGIAISIDYPLKQAQTIIDVIKDPSKLAALQAAPTATTTAAPQETSKPVEEEKEVEVDEDLGGMFGDEDY
ncbi:unnamed protein product [Blepharisma stoltei]|uniref:Large ribosomal subunit protein uL10-like insertion domain-containing protein n=1 Tax=Blepharisma stoltei TaxID=1481888 RepID=A0AAU9K906_9CILI|nr:unnamed protein product [Blepharisma stoltei]